MICVPSGHQEHQVPVPSSNIGCFKDPVETLVCARAAPHNNAVTYIAIRRVYILEMAIAIEMMYDKAIIHFKRQVAIF